MREGTLFLPRIRQKRRIVRVPLRCEAGVGGRQRKRACLGARRRAEHGRRACILLRVFDCSVAGHRHRDRGNRFRVIFRLGGAKHHVGVKAADRKEAEAGLARLEENLRLVERVA